MKRLKTIYNKMASGISAAVSRFPFTVLCLAATAALVCYLIGLDKSAPQNVEKLIFTLGVGAFIGMVAQFSFEGFSRLSNSKLLVYGVAALLTAGYFVILWPAPEISAEIIIRSLVAVFAMICAVLWIPAFRGRTDFNVVSLIHFKSFITSFLFSSVLSGGTAAILFAVDTLLIRVDDNAYGYSMTVIWIIFAPIYYLSRLPIFQADCKDKEACIDSAAGYPRVLEILVSYIAIPLFTAYTIVLLVYFIKILATTQWPSGQLGPMVLVYSAAGVVLFVLASLPENRFAHLFRIIFPKVWIPIVIMQMVSVWIRINAYGITESRYYVALFAVFSLISAIFLSLRSVSKNRYIALLAAAFAIFSIIPPIDAFSVSRNSQINRIEGILQAEGMLSEGVLISKPKASDETKREVTNIIQYLENNSSTEYISWLPKDFEMYRDMKKNFGFDPSYYYQPNDDYRFFYAALDTGIPLDISGYDVSMIVSSHMNVNDKKDFAFEIDDKNYTLTANRISRSDMELTVQDQSGIRLIELSLLDYAESMKNKSLGGKDMLPPNEMTHVKTENGAEIKIIFQNITMENIGENDFYADYAAYVLVKVAD